MKITNEHLCNSVFCQQMLYEIHLRVFKEKVSLVTTLREQKLKRNKVLIIV